MRPDPTNALAEALIIGFCALHPVIFADSRKFAEEWTYRFLAAAFSDAGSGGPVAERR
jgi:hypothetical protein